LSTGEKKGSKNLPEVFNAPIRWDLVEFYHKNARLSKMQPQAVKKDAGHG
jgi:ribosomal protein L4